MWRWITRLGAGRREAQLRRDLEDEILTHLHLRETDLRRAGLGAEEARREAARRFGDADARRRLVSSAMDAEGRRSWGLWLDSLTADLRVALRHVRQAPGFAAVTVATFALGIGATTAVFTVVDHAMLRPLPFPEPDQLVALDSVPEKGEPFPYVSMSNWVDWRQQNRTLQATALYTATQTTLLSEEHARSIAATAVMGPYFDVLRPAMVAGRPFTEAEAQAEENVAVISEGLWRRAMNADPQLGELLLEGGVPTRIVGVVADRHSLLAGTEVWLPRRWRAQSGRVRNNINWYAIARLRPEASIAEARADLGRIADGIRESDPEGIYSWGVGVEGLRSRVVGDSDRTLLTLLAAVLSVLLIGCANLAGQAFARNAAVRRAVAVRVALGATRARVIQQHIVEHVLLAAAGGVAGLALAVVLTEAAVTAGAPVPRAAEVVVDVRILAFGALLSLLAGLFAGVAPAVSVSSAAPRRAMSERGAVAGGRGTPGALLVGAEVALAVVLLIASGLLVRSFGVLTSRELGFDASGLVTAEIALTAVEYRDDTTTLAFWQTLAERAREIPGISTVGLANEVPGGQASGNGFIQVEGWDEATTGATYWIADEGFRTALGVPLLAGRDFAASDAGASERVTIVNREFAETYWPGGSALGRRVRATSMEAPDPEWLTIVGLVENVRYGGFASSAQPGMFVPYRQAPRTPRAMTVVARLAGGDIGATQLQLRNIVRELDPRLASSLGSVTQTLSDLLREQRLVTNTLVGFAAMAIALAALGLHGLLAFQVGQRRQEMAVRAALGARRARLVGIVVRDAALLAAGGAAIGLLVAWWTTRAIAALLVDIEPTDPVTFAGVTLAVLLVAIAAAVHPALRAAAEDPVQALRSG